MEEGPPRKIIKQEILKRGAGLGEIVVDAVLETKVFDISQKIVYFFTI